MKTLGLLALLSTVALAAPKRDVLHAARALNPETGKLISPAWLIIEDGRIVSLTSTKQDGERIELGDVTLVPGFIDAHAHLLHVETPTEDAMIDEAVALSDADRALRAVTFAKQALRAGFTTVRDLGNSGRGGDVSLKRAIAAGWLEGPRVIASTRALSGPLGQFNRLAPQHLALADQEYAIVRTPEEATAAVVNALAEGADVIKVIVDAGKGRELDQLTLNAIVTRAHTARVKVAAHCVLQESAERAIAAGVDSIEHGYNLNDAALAQMAKKNIALVPTDYPAAFYEAFVSEVPAAAQQAVRDRFTVFRASSKDRLARAMKAKVAVVYGSDAYAVTPLNDRGREMQWVFDAYAEAGMSPLDILRSMTSTAARHLGLEAGSFAAGQSADVVALEGDVLKDVKSLSRVKAVFKGGVAVR
ncbi:MAG: amidohydrolase family protein [Archangium sp.]